MLTDYFLNDQNCQDRLVQEWTKYGKLIVAYDFDNTVFDYHSKGHTFENVVSLLRECYKQGFTMIVFTSCSEDRFDHIREYLTENDIPFDYINETPEYIPFTGRKVYYNILLDDRSGLSAAYNQLVNVMTQMKGIKSTQNLNDIG